MGLESIYNRLPHQLRPLAKFIYLSVTSKPRHSERKRIGHAVSDDLKTWRRNPANPVFAPAEDNNDWDGVTVEDPDIVFEDGTFRLFYAGRNEFQWKRKQIGVAQSETGDNWRRHAANPLLSPGPEAWAKSIQNPAVILHDGTYHLVFDGSDNEHGWVGLGYAQADSLEQWQRPVSNPIIELGAPGSWRDQYVADPSLVYHDGVFHIYYAGYGGDSWKIGHATTTDFSSIEQDPRNPLISPDGVLEEYQNLNDPNIIHDGERFHLVFAAANRSVKQLEYASSTDGTDWDLHGCPVLSPDDSTGWEGKRISNPGLSYDGEQYHLFYVGVLTE